MIDTVRHHADHGDIDTLSIENIHGSARISLLGATLIDWTPVGNDSVIWLSDTARFEVGRGIRGGVPLCWPWFGAHAAQPDFSAHGIARTRLWRMIEASDLPDGSTRVRLQLPLEPDHWWPYPSHLEYQVTLGSSLHLQLNTRNSGDSAFEITQALHTYFRVGDIEQVTVLGLEDKPYLDKPDNYRQKHQQGALSFEGETDRIYLQAPSRCVIHDPGLQRRIEIESSGSQSTVVWNPWREVAAGMADMHGESYRSMLCVETANAASDARRVGPGETISLAATYSLARL
jgi:glucose-6-phosphate 1-epimerase